MTDLTRSQRSALRWLHRRGGSAIMDKMGVIVAQGQESRNDAETWLRLALRGYVAVEGSRLVLTAAGEDQLDAD